MARIRREPEGQDAPEGTASDGAVHLEGGFPPGDGAVHLEGGFPPDDGAVHGRAPGDSPSVPFGRDGPEPTRGSRAVWYLSGRPRKPDVTRQICEQH